MPFDGIVVKSIVEELSEMLTGGRVEKIFQPEADEIIINTRSNSQSYRLLLSASANYPRIHTTESSRENPSVPPVFCMLLRKHLSGGRIIGIDFHDFERIVTIKVESFTELGDLTIKKLIIEIMGRHSNIILVNSEDKIIDSIKHVDNEISSVREVMPARAYVLPPSQNKSSPELLNIDEFIDNAKNIVGITLENYILNAIKGFSPLLCREVCYRAGIDGKSSASDIHEDKLVDLKHALGGLVSSIKSCNFSPCIIFSDVDFVKPLDFHCFEIQQHPYLKAMASINEVIDTYYAEKDKSERLKQKKSDLFKVLGNNIDRCNKKLALQQQKLRDVADREKLKLYGELITANIYCISKGPKNVSLLNYYSEAEEYLEIPLDENLLPQENAQRYFKRYTKAKSTFTYTSSQLEENIKELEYLESVLQLLENCTIIHEIEEVRQELIEQGYLISRKKGSKTLKNSKNPKSPKALKNSLPFHFKSTDGLDIYVGKNNRQNDLLTLKSSASNDIWLHTKNIPGSHVIIKKYQYDIPDRTLEEAATLAASHSKARMSSNVPVDFTTVKNVKKPNGAKPGMVIYEHFKTIVVNPNEELVKKLKVDK